MISSPSSLSSSKRIFADIQHDASSSRGLHVVSHSVRVRRKNDWTAPSWVPVWTQATTIKIDVIDGGKLFPTLAAAKGNARSPMVLWFVLGTDSEDIDADRSRLREPMSAVHQQGIALYQTSSGRLERQDKTRSVSGLADNEDRVAVERRAHFFLPSGFSSLLPRWEQTGV